MKKLILILPILLVPFYLFAVESSQPTCSFNVVVIGAGPAGLATAIEARQAGASVQVIEKRDAYTRLQGVFLLDHSLDLLKKWGVSVEHVKIARTAPDMRIGFVQLSLLEKAMAKRATEIGIEISRGELVGLKGDKTILVETASNKTLIAHYDVLVGADGAHSKTRDALGIGVNHLGSAKAYAVFIPLARSVMPPFEVSPTIAGADYYLRRIKTPEGSIIFMQSFAPVSQEKLREGVAKEGWVNEVRELAEPRGFPVDVELSQAQAFSDAKNVAILVGDAAATASFFRGMGANTAFRTAEVAGVFFETLIQKGLADYYGFDQAVKHTTDNMIQDSQFLFDYST